MADQEPEKQELSGEKEPQAEDNLASTEREEMERHGKAWWKEGDAPKWPLWLMLGLAGAAIVSVIIWGVSVPKWANRPAPTELVVNAVYRLSAATSMCERSGSDTEGPGVKKLPVGTEIGVVRAEMMDGAKWYYVQADDALGNRIGIGWVSSKALGGQKLEMVRDRLERQP